ncbi:G-type lectin S-receptor-like serine/threonine-protein kinase CES101 [Tanacetum coccineum]
MEGVVSTKTDVFSFGVLLLEIVSSKMNHGSYDVEHPLNLPGLAWELWNKGRGLDFMDPVLEDACPHIEVMTCIHVGLLCVQDHAIDRPTISEVISMLTNENMHLPEPKQPAFFIERRGTEAARHDNLEMVSNWWCMNVFAAGLEDIGMINPTLQMENSLSPFDDKTNDTNNPSILTTLQTSQRSPFKWIWRLLGHLSYLWARVIKNIHEAHGENALVATQTSLLDWFLVFRRASSGGVELSQFEALQAVIRDVVLTDHSDS